MGSNPAKAQEHVHIVRIYYLHVIIALALSLGGVVSAQEANQGTAVPASATDKLVLELIKEVADLTKSVAGLRESIRGLDTTIIADLQLENDRLRDAVRLRYERLGGGPPVPMPNRELIQQVYREERTEQIAENFSPIEPQDFKYTIVSEWGRSPQVAEQAGDSSASLKGMVLSVPQGSTDADLIDFATDLRRELGAYDNINIEVFDGIEAARRYAQTGASDANRRVLSISKFSESGRDVILLIRGNTIRQIDLPSE